MLWIQTRMESSGWFPCAEKNTDVLDQGRTEQIRCKQWTEVSIMHCSVGKLATARCSICVSYHCYSQVYRTSFIFFPDVYMYWVQVPERNSEASALESHWRLEGKSEEKWKNYSILWEQRSLTPKASPKHFLEKRGSLMVSNASWDGSLVADLFALLLSWTA